MGGTGKPVRAGDVFVQAGAVATAVQAEEGLHWEVRRESDGLVRFTKCLADVSHWQQA
jgi:2-keto-4-pentenoate hydratase